jgi:DNA-binding MarR family transcriptional regulator
MVRFFGVTPPSAHSMVVKLEELGLVTREPGVARSVRIVIPEDEVPKLEDTEGMPW